VAYIKEYPRKVVTECYDVQNVITNTYLIIINDFELEIITIIAYLCA